MKNKLSNIFFKLNIYEKETCIISALIKIVCVYTVGVV